MDIDLRARMQSLPRGGESKILLSLASISELVSVTGRPDRDEVSNTVSAIMDYLCTEEHILIADILRRSKQHNIGSLDAVLAWAMI